MFLERVKSAGRKVGQMRNNSSNLFQQRVKMVQKGHDMYARDSAELKRNLRIFKA